jgi:hypothetical protein
MDVYNVPNPISPLFFFAIDRINSTPMTVGELAEAIGESPVSVIKFLMTDLGVMAAVSQTLDPSTCEAVAEGFGKVVAGEDDEYDDEEE